MVEYSIARRTFCWVGAATCVVFLAAWVTSLWWRCIRSEVVPYESGGAPAIEQFGLERGCIVWKVRLGHGGSPGHIWWYWGRERDVVVWAPNRVDELSSLGYRATHLPLWIPLVVIGVPAGLLWWRGYRRPRRGHCPRCGYDLTGNVSGRCPECGAVVRTGEAHP